MLIPWVVEFRMQEPYRKRQPFKRGSLASAVSGKAERSRTKYLPLVYTASSEPRDRFVPSAKAPVIITPPSVSECTALPQTLDSVTANAAPSPQGRPYEYLSSARSPSWTFHLSYI